MFSIKHFQKTNSLEFSKIKTMLFFFHLMIFSTNQTIFCFDSANTVSIGNLGKIEKTKSNFNFYRLILPQMLFDS